MLSMQQPLVTHQIAHQTCFRFRSLEAACVGIWIIDQRVRSVWEYRAEVQAQQSQGSNHEGG